ncbi:hypothetical protein PAXINDRAFT_12078 [Paxillus involutus ATCC 200175]|uniref:Uncharacterized protein n=1 Tax=Paxillus involutus ATCC 200175 TaxID=664439 RepID=A0A0C9SYR1_PAXIN|nr:hypothetical protein PAXINDRAFT_12078 [Paxillus involutus ATCC 200175]
MTIEREFCIPEENSRHEEFIPDSHVVREGFLSQKPTNFLQTDLREIGDGAGPEVSLHMLQAAPDHEDLIRHVFPSQVLRLPELCLKRAILCPTNLQVVSYNNAILAQVDGPQRSYLAADLLKEVEEAGLIAPHPRKNRKKFSKYYDMLAARRYVASGGQSCKGWWTLLTPLEGGDL